MREAEHAEFEARISASDRRFRELEERFEEFYKNMHLVDSSLHSMREKIKDHASMLESMCDLGSQRCSSAGSDEDRRSTLDDKGRRVSLGDLACGFIAQVGMGKTKTTHTVQSSADTESPLTCASFRSEGRGTSSVSLKHGLRPRHSRRSSPLPRSTGPRGSQ
mmetsp:Transcript_15071/g.41432  ORF Transcript_15071/g.41432 Transcript_15071/m.41432 type:complete len:163 (-) Transcript_15071:554-1042(-)